MRYEKPGYTVGLTDPDLRLATAAIVGILGAPPQWVDLRSDLPAGTAFVGDGLSEVRTIGSSVGLRIKGSRIKRHASLAAVRLGDQSTKHVSFDMGVVDGQHTTICLRLLDDATGP
ncbi:hypothetical protein [Xanthomonas oryzae]|uniref:hypothetical protein n=1 Tax=Xanthomonas oryzae TaxID=347 RepID=UPI003CCF204E